MFRLIVTKTKNILDILEWHIIHILHAEGIGPEWTATYMALSESSTVQLIGCLCRRNRKMLKGGHMQDLIRLLRTLYLISKNSEKHEVVIDEDTLKLMLDTLKNETRK